MSKSRHLQLLHFDLGSQKFLLQLLLPLEPLPLLLKVHCHLPVIGQHQFVLLFGQVQRAEALGLVMRVDVVRVDVVGVQVVV